MIATHPAALPVDKLLEQCQIRRGRRSGPGGQHRNKVETAVTITHSPTQVQGDASEKRSQEQNRQAAVFRLRVNLALEIRQPASEQLSELWRKRSPGNRLSISGQHPDFPAILAEALDHLADRQWDQKAAAECLQISASQLIKLMKIEPRGLQKINSQRLQLGLRPLQ